MLFSICCHFFEGKKTSSFCFCWMLSADVWMGKKTMFARRGKKPSVEAGNYTLLFLVKKGDGIWKRQDSFCWRILPAAFSDFRGWVSVLTSLIASWSVAPRLDLELSESHFIKCCRGGEGQRSQGSFPRGTTSGGDPKEYNLTGYWRRD